VSAPGRTTFRVAPPEREPFSSTEVAGIRRSRRHPRRSDYLYLHLRSLLDDLARALENIPGRDVLDIYCGARPYEDLLPDGARCTGLDVDDAYGLADVVSDQFLPFEPASFDLVLCTQAFYFLPRPVDAVAEIACVLRPGGKVVITAPVAYPGTNRLYTEYQLRELFSGWESVSVVASGGTAVARATLSGYLLHHVERRLTGAARPLRAVFPLLYVLVNGIGSALDHVERRYLATADRLPTNLLLTATKPPAQ
jgi:SAM-dependent methyltransferase